MNPEIFREYDIRGIAGKDLTEDDVLCRFSIPVSLPETPGFVMNENGLIRRRPSHPLPDRVSCRAPLCAIVTQGLDFVIFSRKTRKEPMHEPRANYFLPDNRFPSKEKI